nr:immunoglobulin heavy chain junction region [Mus musculus]
CARNLANWDWYFDVW